MGRKVWGREVKFSDCDARRSLRAAGVPFDEDFHALPRSHVDLILGWAKATGYRKSKNAPGSRARMYFQHLARKRGC